MSAPTCNEIERLIPDHLAGARPEAERARVESHLSECPACRELVDTLRLLHGAMRELPLRETLDERRKEVVLETFRLRAGRPSAKSRWASLLELFNPARPPKPALRFAVAALVFVVLPVLMMALLLPATQQARKRADATAAPVVVAGSGEVVGRERDDAGAALAVSGSVDAGTGLDGKDANGQLVMEGLFMGRSSGGRGVMPDAEDRASASLEHRPEEEVFKESSLSDFQTPGAYSRTAASAPASKMTPQVSEIPKPMPVSTPAPARPATRAPAAPAPAKKENEAAKLRNREVFQREDKDVAAFAYADKLEGKVGGGRFAQTAAEKPADHGDWSGFGNGLSDRKKDGAKEQLEALRGHTSTLDELTAGALGKEGTGTLTIPEPEPKPASALAGDGDTLVANDLLGSASGEQKADAPTAGAKEVRRAGGEMEDLSRAEVVHPHSDGVVVNAGTAVAADGPRPSTPREPAGFHPYVEAQRDAFSTFSIDVDTASYTLTRQALAEGRLPDPEEVRTEEIVNAFDYDYAPPASGAFAIHAERAPSPFRAPLELLKIGVQGRLIGRDAKRPAVLTLVIDGSGSMDTDDRLGRIRKALRLLAGQLKPQDSIAIVQFSEQPRLALDRTAGSNRDAVLAAVDALAANGSTDLEAGLRLGYEVAAAGFRSGAANRVILLSDGVANLGAGQAEAILATVEQYRKQGIYLTVLGFGRGNYDDAMLEQLADKGDGQYAFVDSDAEAQRLLVDQWEQTLHVIARDVKIQVEFNPDRVTRWRQLGYENRKLRKEDFRNDAVDAGEVGSGQAVTALYDVELAGNAALPIATVRVRFKNPDTGAVSEIEQRIGASDRHADFVQAPARFQVASCAAEFAELLRVSPYAAGTDFDAVAAALRPAALELPLDQRVQELLRLVNSAAGLSK